MSKQALDTVTKIREIKLIKTYKTMNDAVHVGVY